MASLSFTGTFSETISRVGELPFPVLTALSEEHGSRRDRKGSNCRTCSIVALGVLFRITVKFSSGILPSNNAGTKVSQLRCSRQTSRTLYPGLNYCILLWYHTTLAKHITSFTGSFSLDSGNDWGRGLRRGRVQGVLCRTLVIPRAPELSHMFAFACNHPLKAV